MCGDVMVCGIVMHGTGLVNHHVMEQVNKEKKHTLSVNNTQCNM